MIIATRPQRQYGRPIDQREMRSARSVVGDVIVIQQKFDFFNRYVTVAQFHILNKCERPPVALLYDMALSWMGNQGFVLFGVGILNNQAFSQSWFCQPVERRSTEHMSIGMCCSIRRQPESI